MRQMKRVIENEAAAGLIKQLQMACVKANQAKAKLDLEMLMKIAKTTVIGHSEFRQAPCRKMSSADVVALLNNDAFKKLGSKSMRGDL